MRAPEPHLRACLAVIRRAVIEARLIGYAAEQGALTREEGARLAALMDAVHNIPELVHAWERCNLELLRWMLQSYDAAWGGALDATYRAELARGPES